MQTLIAINQLDKKYSIIKGDADNVINDLKATIILVYGYTPP